MARRRALTNADVLLLVGTKLDFRLNYGQPPLIPKEPRSSGSTSRPRTSASIAARTSASPATWPAALSGLAAALGSAPDHASWLAPLREVETKAREADEKP